MKLTWKYNNIPTAITTPTDRPMLKSAKTNIHIEGGLNGKGLVENTANNQLTKMYVETQHPATPLAKNAVK